MTPAALIAAAQARGVNLSHVGGTASNLDGDAQERRLTRAERKLGFREVRLTANGSETRAYRRPAVSHAELGQAAAGLGPIPWNAALFSFAGARDGYWLLWRALAAEALRLAKREHWAPRVIKEDGSERFFCEDLAELVLIHDSNQHLFTAAPQLFAIYMHVTPSVWDQSLDGPFRSLKGSYERWLGVARGAIGRWIRED